MSRLRLQKIMPLATFSDSNNERRASRFFAGATSNNCWLTLSLVEDGRATSTRTGADKNCSERRVISGGIVAEKNSVWRVNGTSETIRSISGIKPISNMRSASSITKTSTPRSKTPPRSTWSSRRPGVAINTSAPRKIACSWSLKLTPPISRALLSFVFLP